MKSHHVVERVQARVKVPKTCRQGTTVGLSICMHAAHAGAEADRNTCMLWLELLQAGETVCADQEVAGQMMAAAIQSGSTA